ncbi:MAG: LacI family transcriptional regulator [Bacteroidales bacterium]|jgi:LacI family transcriptional regulator|nr:LacI family transcriptional regulator [Bacteroidales bacterium]MCI2121645.1 LacI family transcriptional regulator [Bacteroidales bacterium]MCI2144959.1 LacI family transcriptional regulator [Bacteroidales bacterium]
MKNETLFSIAKRTGFSISTVSRVLSGNGRNSRISEKTAKIIREEAQKCNYTPSALAKGLRTNKTDTLGLIIPSIDNPYFANIAHIIIQEARSHDYTIILVDTMEDEILEREGISSLLSRKVDGMVVVPCGQNADLLERTNGNEMPVVLVDRYYGSTSLPYVCTDNFNGGYIATRHLIDKGHKKIACIEGPRHSMPVKERVRGYMQALKEAGLEENANIVGENFSIQNGYVETKLLLNKKERPTAIFSLSNTILLGSIKAINESGLHIPDDISAISFDNYAYLDYMNPSITRISQPIEEIGILAVKLLIESIAQGKNSTSQIQLPPRLIECNSVRNLFL